ncbi:g7192 [Coccomyxa viridis]|uniref:G7192 protein n=1 Tax=Coccomyxa viridis TaxID=1274662 RepID=A0ABP1FZN9_9CHLO
MTTALEGNPHRRSSLELPNLLSLSKQKSRVLGSGAYGVVKSVRLNADQGLVAVKTLRAHASTSEMECFAREKEILRNLDHKWSLQVADALTYLHGLSPKIIFRDLSAANVMLTSAKLDRADVKLIDFGLAKVAPQRIAPTSLHADGCQPQPGAEPCEIPCVEGLQVKDPGVKAPELGLKDLDTKATAYTAETGSYMYMCPEVTKHESYDEKCDVFAMGCLMYDLYTRQLRHVSLFQNASMCTVDAHVLGQYAVKVAGGYRPEIPADMPEAVRALVEACWAQEACARPNACEVKKALEEHMATLAEQPTRRSSLQLFRRSRSDVLNGADSGSLDKMASTSSMWRAGSGSLRRWSSTKVRENAII